MKKLLLSIATLLLVSAVAEAQTEVTLTEAGTLRQQITDDIKNVTTLKVNGPINGTDLRFLRELCGIMVSGGPSSGRLADLDLSDADIVRGGDYYMYDYSSYEEFFTVDNQLGQYAFFNCPAIERITLPKSLQRIGTSAFSSCARLNYITVPEENEALYSIDGSVYSKADARLIKYPQARNLRHFIVPDGTKIIGYDAVSDALSLELITLPEGLTTIERTAFCFSNNLTNIDIPASVTSIGVSAFNYCAGLETINVDENSKSYASQDGILYTKDMTTLVRCPLKRAGSFVVPTTVTTLEEYAFSSCTKLTGITLPSGLTTISDWAFDGCRQIPSFDIPSTVTTIGNGVFGGCSIITSIALPDAVNRIGRWLFYDCSALKDITISADVLSIGDGAFQNCTSLDAFEVPQRVTTIPQQTFYGCQALTSVVLPEGITTIGAYAFYGCKALRSLTVYAQTPPFCQTYPFFQVPTGSCLLTVPYGTADDYRTANEWKNFTNITEMEGSSIEAIQANQSERYFTIDGKPLTKPQKGLNIVRSSDGSVKKVMF